MKMFEIPNDLADVLALWAEKAYVRGFRHGIKSANKCGYTLESDEVREFCQYMPQNANDAPVDLSTPLQELSVVDRHLSMYIPPGTKVERNEKTTIIYDCESFDNDGKL